MIQNKQRAVVGLLLTVLLIWGVSVGVQAAVVGDFTSSYDATAEDDDPGRDITISGTIDFTGSNAVNPNIEIRPGQGTVLDTTSINVLVGDAAVDFNQHVEPGRVILTTDEIPAGTEIRLDYNVYPRGTSDVNVTASEVIVRYDTPGGDSQVDQFSAFANLSDSPSVRLTDLSEANTQLQQENSQLQSEMEDLRGGGGANWEFRFMALLGVVLVGLLGWLGIKYWNSRGI